MWFIPENPSTLNHMSHNLNGWETIIGSIQKDTRSLDYSLHEASQVSAIAAPPDTEAGPKWAGDTRLGYKGLVV